MTIFTPGTRVTVKPETFCHHRHGVVVDPPDNMPDGHGHTVLVEFPDCDVWSDLPCEDAFNETELEVQS